MPAEKRVEIPENIVEILPAIRMILSSENGIVLKIKNSSLIESHTQNEQAMTALTGPDFIYCNSALSPGEIIADVSRKVKSFKDEHKSAPGLILIKDYGLIAAGKTAAESSYVLEGFEQLMRNPGTSQSVKSPTSSSEKGRLENKIAIVTGGAQGFGEGLVRGLFREGANVVIADINDKVGTKLADELNLMNLQNQAICVQTDISDEKMIRKLVYETVVNFGGLDLFISNAGILRAGGLDEMDQATFDLVTKINYNAYFYCTKVAAEVLKLQYAYNNNWFSDIIQINSKSGLAGSKKNFAYAGGKFGGIGLTQSFAMELAPYRIKVNSVCPGNFFEGPLWSDPDNGLFVQYLNAGKVPGAKTLDDVKAFYQNQVPLGRGCSTEDVLRAVLYLVDQKYETGQALPVTGGQVMLN